MSLGTSPNPLIRSTTPGLEVNRKGCLVVNEDHMTTRDQVYAGGRRRHRCGHGHPGHGRRQGGRRGHRPRHAGEITSLDKPPPMG